MMGRATRELLGAVAIVAIAIVAAVYVSERVNLRRAYESGMAEVFDIVRSLHR